MYIICMSKKHTTLSIKSDVIEEAKRKFLNMSEIAEKAIKEKLNIIEVEIDNPKSLTCKFCGLEGTKETAKEAKEEIGRKNALTWLYPDEKWICNICLKEKYNALIITK